MPEQQGATLYKRDSKGKTRVWWVETDGAIVLSHHGIQGGKMVTQRTAAKPKNIGRSNATTGAEQAVLEAMSKWTRQVQRDDYNEDVEKAGLQLRAMLALDGLKVPHRINWVDAVAQPKLNGVRLSVGNRDASTDAWVESQYELMTRKGDNYVIAHLETPTKILLSIVNSLCGGRCLALDGEVYKHGLALQTILAYTKKHRAGKSETLEYHVFDLVIREMTFSDRYSLLLKAHNLFVEQYPEYAQLVPIVPLLEITEETEPTIHGECAVLGYEGLMIRHRSGLYKIGGRSPDLFKLKRFYDDEFQIVDVTADANGCAMYTCVMKDGQKLTCEDHMVVGEHFFDCTPKLSHAERRRLFQEEREELIGKWVTVKYQELTLAKKPEFPVGLAIRECDVSGKPLE